MAEHRADAFVRGLVSGAMVGAVIAGSAIWERRRRRPGTAPAGRPPGLGGTVPTGSPAGPGPGSGPAAA